MLRCENRRTRQLLANYCYWFVPNLTPIPSKGVTCIYDSLYKSNLQSNKPI